MLGSILKMDLKPGNYIKIEQVRNLLRGNPELIELEQFGAGSFNKNPKEVQVKDIAEQSLSKPWQCKILFRLGRETGAKTIIELGTSLGISTSYLASLNHGSTVYTFEGSHVLTQYARVVFNSLNLNNIEISEGNFDTTLPEILKKLPHVDFSFIDGNHTFEATKKYFDWLVNKSSDHSVIVMDDIYWSKEMYRAWKEIIKHPKVKASINLYKFGIIFLNPKAAGHYKVFTKNLFDI
ncbi:MAG TPA: class I SAM-dependent methyltransferase [Saprospiraceae bacterium]|nr:class I SAM-dependent methyltransferase [Saprospiraceae bacterium]